MKVTKTITTENVWTDPIFPKRLPSTDKAMPGGNAYCGDYGALILSISGTWVGTITLQIAYDFGTTWLPTGETFTENTVQKITGVYEPGVSFRIGCATGDFTSGSCNVRLSI